MKLDNSMAKKNNTPLNIPPIKRGSTIQEICDSINCEYGTPAWPDKFGSALSAYLQNNKIATIRTLSLFSGAGGLDIGFHDLGFEIVASVEIESKFCDTLAINSGEGKKFSSSKVNCIDIRDFSGDNLGQIDFIIGGPPCQTFSAAGRRAAGVLGTTDARGVLFREYVRLLEKLQPKGFLFENVYGIVGAQNGEAWKEIQKSFSDVGYKLYFRILDAADYGVPQHRERLIIVGLKKGTFEFPRPTHGMDSLNHEPHYSAGLAVSGLELTEDERKVGITGRFGALINEIPPGLNYSFFTAEMGHPKPIFAWRSKFSDFMYKADPEMPVRTIKAQGGQYTGPLHWDSRYFAYSEFKRLQTFPDDYQISGVKQVAVQQIGNSVPPQLARMLALAIRIQVFGTQFPFTLSTLDEKEVLSFRKNKRALTNYYRQKAIAAIAQANEDNNALEGRMAYKNVDYYMTMSDKFRCEESSKGGDFAVSVNWSDILQIEVTPKGSKAKKTIIVDIAPSEDWTLPVASIKLLVNSSKWIAVTAAWKVLDKELKKYDLKADLVQLNGYYQYVSQIHCNLQCGSIAEINTMKPIYTGEIVGKNVTTQELAETWGIAYSQVLDKALYLRSLGYEVRNNHTNTQIPEGIWIIPYKFPTLLPESIQLNKTLV